MVITRSQSNRKSRIEQTEMDTISDEDSNTIVPDLSSSNYFAESNEEASGFKEKTDHETHRIEQRFMKMHGIEQLFMEMHGIEQRFMENRQIGEVTSNGESHNKNDI